MRVANEGDAGMRGGTPGDLYVYLFVEEDKEFKRDGVDILSEYKINYLQAILGCRVKIKTVDGSEEVTIPPGTQPNTVLTLESKGVPKLGNPVSRGDHLITIIVTIPNRISAEERELLEKLAKIKGNSDKSGGIEGFLGGFFK